MPEHDSVGLEASGKSLDSNSSLSISTEQGRFTQPVDNNPNNSLSCERFTDSVSAMIICRAHRKLALSVLHSHPSQDLWFPVYPLKSEQCYDEATNLLLKLVLSKESNPSHSVSNSSQTYSTPQLVHTMRLQVPRCLEFVTRTLFFTELLPPVSGQCSCAINTQWLTWYAFSEVLNLPNLHGPEPLIGALFLLSATGSNSVFPESCYRSYEISIRKLTQAPISGVHSELLQKSNCGPEDIQLVYSDYVQHCYPSPYMNEHSFCDYITRAHAKLASGVTKDELQSMFRAFDSTNAHYIDFFDFVSGLAVLDKTTPHSNHCAKVRGEYIFRFYSQAKDLSTVDYNDICRLAHDMMLIKSSQKPDKIIIEKQVNKMYECFGVPVKSPVSKATFAKAIEKANFGDISQVLRANSSIEVIKRRPQYPVLKNKPNSNNVCTRCRDKKYSLAAHHVTLQMDGCSVNPGLMHQVSEALQGSMAVRKKSDEIFASSSVYNQLMDKVRDFVENGSISEWSNKQHRIETVPLIKQVCLEARKLFSAEARVIKVQSPCFVFGDIHGNLHDLMIYEHNFWRIGAACLSNNFLFLGDYVDRGEHSVECALYLLCAKLLTPARFHLLRGNHEVRLIQRQFTFYAECNSKFAGLGNQVWQAFNEAFDCLPIAAVIDEKIYCAHGGIPASISKLDKLATTIPCPLESPMLESPVAWEIMWNDPITKQEFDSITNEMQQQLANYPVGFLPNTKRCTAFFFGDEATKSFLALNGLSHVIRAHEVVAQGFNMHFGGRVITVFSCSRYCGMDNQAACILVGLDNKLRVIKIDTNDKE